MRKIELWKNLHTTDLLEANRKKHKEIALMIEDIAQAKRNYEAKAEKFSKVDQITRYVENLWEATFSNGGSVLDQRKAKLEMLERKVFEQYGLRSSAILSLISWHLMTLW